MKTEFQKVLSKTDVGETESNISGGFTIPKAYATKDFFEEGFPNLYTFSDKSLQSDFEFYIKVASNKEVRVSRCTDYFKLKNAKANDSIQVIKQSENGKTLYYIDILSNDDKEKAKVIYAFLKSGYSHRKIQKEILGQEAKANGGGFLTMTILHDFEIEGVKKGILNRIPYDKEYESSTGKYREALDLLKKYYPELFSDLNSKQSLKSKKVDLANIKEEFANWLFNFKKYSRVYKGDKAILIEKLNEFEIAYNNDFGILIFGYPIVSIESIIQALETNIIDETGEIGDLNRRTVGNGSVKAILGPNNYIKFLKELLVKLKTSVAKSPKIAPINKIYFGAPGTGKSYQITQDLKSVDLIFQKRVTFHPEYDNASFVGGYKPITDINGDIKYEFVPQIFTNIYIDACNDSEHQYYLIIEEINRGNCAEIFGELFQLLDRNTDYKITPSNELIKYLNNNISNTEFYKEGNMLLPDNLSILATMNTSDQSLFPMDSAFKRRWEWEYIPIRYENDNNSDENGELIYNDSFDYKVNIKGRMFSWIRFIETVNKKIEKNENLGMDKCLGNYFIKADSTTKEISLKQFVNKVIFYLWNDVFKDEFEDSIFILDSKNKFSFMDFFPEANASAAIVKIIEYLTKYRETELEKNDGIWLIGTTENSSIPDADIPDADNIIDTGGISNDTNTSDASNNTEIPADENPENKS